MTIGLIARDHTSGGLSALLESDREDEASEVEEFKFEEKKIRDKEIPCKRENQNDITPNSKKTTFKRKHYHLDSRPERNITNSGRYSEFKLNNNLWKCELEIEI